VGQPFDSLRSLMAIAMGFFAHALFDESNVLSEPLKYI